MRKNFWQKISIFRQFKILSMLEHAYAYSSMLKHAWNFIEIHCFKLKFLSEKKIFETLKSESSLNVNFFVETKIETFFNEMQF